MKLKPKKTLKVKVIQEFINNFLLNSEDDQEQERKGMATILEQILHETNNYNGFNYLNSYDMGFSTAKTKTPGINHYEYSDSPDKKDTRFEGCLTYRRIYFYRSIQ